MARLHHPHAAALAALAGLASAAHAQVNYTEVEPNDSKVKADQNGPIVLKLSGDPASPDGYNAIVGNSTGSSTTNPGAANSTDYFLIKTMPMAQAIYRHRLLYSGPTSILQIINLRGLGQWDRVINYNPGPLPAGQGTDDAIIAQRTTTATANTPAHTMTWYGFGREEQLYENLSGSSTTTTDYTQTYERTVVTPISLGTFAGGLMTISTAGMGHTTDTELWVYDSTLHPIPGFNNDNMGWSTDPGGGVNSTLTRDFVTPGVYYLAISGGGSATVAALSNNLASATDDRLQGGGSGVVTDYPDLIVSGNNTPNLNCAFQITGGDGVNTQYPSGGAVNVTRAEPQEINWYTLTVTAPVTGACCQPDGSCTAASQAGCNTSGGTWNSGQACGSVTCTQPPAGACCMNDATCATSSSYACAAAGGVWRGAGIACGSTACPLTQATFPATPPGPITSVSASFFDVTAGASPLTITAIDYYAAQGIALGGSVGPQGQLYVFPGGSYVGNTQGANNTTPPAGWSLNTSYSFPANPGAWTPLHVVLTTPVSVPANQTVGFYLTSATQGVRPAGLNPADPNTYTGPDMTVFSLNSHSAVAANYPYWAATLTSGRTFIGRIYYGLPPACYANCDSSTAAPILNVQDFTCFLQKYASQNAYANCDSSTAAPILNVQDFTCFLQKYAAGCS